MTTLSSVSDDKFSPSQRKKIIAGAIGNSLEYVDWALYGLLAPVFASQFFPETDPVAALIGTLAIYAVGFVARPLGGTFLGAFGDRFGRKTGLAVSILIMSGGSLLIALAPTYTMIGLLAPALLLTGRLAQGFAAGGEYGTSMAYMIESAPARRRGLGGSFQQVSISMGILLASVIAAVLTSLLNAKQMSQYGWRVGFIIVAILGFAAYLYRRNVGESDTFVEMKKENTVTKTPVRFLFKDYKRTVFWVIAIASPISLVHYIWVTYLPAYASTTYGYPLNEVLFAQTISTVMLVFVIPVFGRLSDKIGRRPMLIASSAASLLLSWPAFNLIGLGLGTYYVTQIIMVLLLAPYLAVLTSVLVEHTPARVRSTAIGLPYAIAVALFGGTAPLIITALAEGGFLQFVWIYPAIVSLAAVILFIIMRETAFKPLEDTEALLKASGSSEMSAVGERH